MNGELVDWTAQQYHTDREWLNSTRIKKFAESREKYADEYESDDPPKKPISEALMFGSAVHCELDGEPFLRCDCGYKSKAFAAMVEANPYMPIVPESDVERVKATCAAVMQNLTARELYYSPGDREQTILWEHPETGLKLKCRLDRLCSDGRILDVKTTRDIDKFGHAISNYQYDLQAAQYRLGVYSLLSRWPDFIFIAVESQRPHRVRCIKLPENVQSNAHMRLFLHLKMMAICRETWDYTVPESNGVHEAILPGWHYTQYGIGE